MFTRSPLHSLTTLALLFNLSKRRIQQLVKQGIIHKATHGKYDVAASVQGYIDYVQKCAFDQSDADSLKKNDFKFQRKRLIKAQTNKAKHKHQKLKGNLVSLKILALILNEVTTFYMSEIDALPERLAHELAEHSEPAEMKRKVVEQCQRIRINTAEHLRQFAVDLERGKSLHRPGGRTESEKSGSMS